MSSDPLPEEEHLQDLYNEIRSMLECRGHVTPTGQAVVLMRVALENGGEELGMTGILHILSSLMTQTLGIMSDDDKESQKDDLKDVLRAFNQNKTPRH
jgi:hypothetical protein|tara:strand:+ start:62 stop:355 length:294 start_codon:yes stop_codon:yes gene_type:complete